jgi:hypothetical protein
MKDKTVLRFSWPLETDDVVDLTIQEAREMFPDCFENPEWSWEHCGVDPIMLDDHLKIASPGDVYTAGFCEVEVLVNKDGHTDKDSCRNCQDCAEAVALEDSHGEGDAWLCGDCYGDRREAQQKRERSQAAWDLACYTVRTRSADAGFVAYCVDFLGAYTAPCKESPMGRLLEWTRWDDCVGPVRMVEGVGGAA